MLNKAISLGIICLSFLAIQAQAQTIERWYTPEQAEMGKPLFTDNCAVCHGSKGQGASNWQKRNAKGYFPPPPLNGTAHTWHHPLKLLRYTIERGGAPVGGIMPSFKDKLTDEQRDAIIAWFQSMWSDEVYANWLKRGGLPDDMKPPAKTRSSDTAKEQVSTPKALETQPTPVKDILQTKIGEQYVYMTVDGRYGFVGDLLDLQTGENLTEKVRRKDRLAIIDTFALKDMTIVPAIGNEKSHITVFTDTSCPFCRKLHKEVPQLSKAGIAVRYIPFPRGGKSGPGTDDLRSVWCSKDRAKAMSIAKGIQEGLLEFGDCAAARAVDQGLKLAIKLGLRGTPAIILPDGELISGYRPAESLIKTLIQK